MNKFPTKGNYLEIILRSKQTVFSVNDIVLLWGERAVPAVRVRLNYYVKTGKLVRIYRGFYAKDNHFDILELASKIYTPAYISFETVLTQSGINFQHYSTIFVASYINREITVGDYKIKYIRTKDYVLSSMIGVRHESGYSVASPERAFLDRLYISRDYYLDNPTKLNWSLILDMVPSYHNQRLTKKVTEYYAALHT